MITSPKKRPHILFLFSDTGGGHRSAAEAIIEAIQLEFGESISTEMLDIFKTNAPWPLNHFPDWYPQMVRIPQIWGFGYYISNGRRRARVLRNSMWPYVRRAVKQLIANHPSDLIVSVHPVANGAFLHALGSQRPPFITVVTDLVTTHALWYDKRTDLCIVPTETAGKRAIRWSLTPEQVRVIGLPVADRFCQPPRDRFLLRDQLRWPQDLPMIVLIGGGEGMGPLEKTSLSIDSAGLRVGLAIITGRNQKLKQRLEARSWQIPVFVYGFVKNMPDFMGAADILITKAGPGTISEALNAGLPMILYSRLPGQEDGNVTYIVETGAGVWAPTPEEIVTVLRTWIEQPQSRQAAAAISQRLARPQSARKIAHILAQKAGLHG